MKYKYIEVWSDTAKNYTFNEIHSITLLRILS